MRKIGVLGIGLVMLFAPAATHAETDIRKAVLEKAEKAAATVRAACSIDVKTFCSQVTPGDGRLMLCMMAHEDKISANCFGALIDVGDAVELTISSVKRAAAVCAPEIEQLCRDVRAGEGKVAQCLISNKAKLSQPCGAEVAGIEARIKN